MFSVALYNMGLYIFLDVLAHALGGVVRNSATRLVCRGWRKAALQPFSVAVGVD